MIVTTKYKVILAGTEMSFDDFSKAQKVDQLNDDAMRLSRILQRMNDSIFRQASKDLSLTEQAVKGATKNKLTCVQRDIACDIACLVLLGSDNYAFVNAFVEEFNAIMRVKLSQMKSDQIEKSLGEVK